MEEFKFSRPRAEGLATQIWVATCDPLFPDPRHEQPGHNQAMPSPPLNPQLNMKKLKVKELKMPSGHISLFITNREATKPV